MWIIYIYILYTLTSSVQHHYPVTPFILTSWTHICCQGGGFGGLGLSIAQVGRGSLMATLVLHPVALPPSVCFFQNFLIIKLGYAIVIPKWMLTLRILNERL